MVAHSILMAASTSSAGGSGATDSPRVSVSVMATKSVHFEVFGKVQGVFFRKVSELDPFAVGYYR